MVCARGSRVCVCAQDLCECKGASVCCERECVSQREVEVHPLDIAAETHQYVSTQCACVCVCVTSKGNKFPEH